MKSKKIKPSIYVDQIFKKFININNKISELVLDESEKLNDRSIFIIAQCGAKLFLESQSSDLELSQFDSAIDFEDEKHFYQDCVAIIKYKKFDNSKQPLSIQEKHKEQQIQLELFS